MSPSSTGISILYTNPTPEPPNRFSFLEPLSPEVWLYMAFAYVGVSVMLFVLARSVKLVPLASIHVGQHLF